MRDRLGMDWVDTCGTAYKLGGWAVVIGELIAGVGGKKAFKEGLEQGRDRLFRSGVREGGDEARERAAREAAEAAAERRARSKPPKQAEEAAPKTGPAIRNDVVSTRTQI